MLTQTGPRYWRCPCGLEGGFSAQHFLLGATIILSSFAAHAEQFEKMDSGQFTLLFVGGAAGDNASPTLRRLKDRLRSLDPKRGLVVFTGNYSVGELPHQGEDGRAQAEDAILAHVAATADFAKRGGRVYFLPGHRDFAGGGTKAVRRLRKFLNRAFAQAVGDSDSDDLDVMPQASCGDTTLLELTDNLGLLLVNSQWWMQDWANDARANEGCDVKTRTAFEKTLQDSLRSYRTRRRLVIASHHPLRSYGELGGSFTVWAHLTPAPILGTAWVLARQAGLVEQYQNHPMVRSYLDVMLDEAQRYGSYVFASGHDANLQFLHVEKQVQLVSGTSARSAEPTVGASAEDFAAATPGWAELVIEPSGEGEARFFSGGADDEVLFQTRLPTLVPPGPAPAEVPKPFPTGLVTTTYTKEHVWQMGSVLKLLVGSFYSSAYALELPYETLNLETEQGGLKPRAIGGNFQTNSLKLRDPQGGEWAMREVTKDASRVFAWPQNQATILNRLIDHGYTAIHPEAALAVPRLAQAVGVLHAEPRLLYVPDQEGLGRYRGFISDEVVLLERKPKAPKEGVLLESLAGAPSAEGKTTFKSTEDTIDKTIDNPDKHRVDQDAMLRARLLDNFLGDWDRHEGQWVFAVTPNVDGTKTYRPIASDRDQVFANYDGLLLVLARIASPAPRELQPFDGDYGSVAWLNAGAGDIDTILLNQIPRKRWLAIAKQMQSALTDKVIDEAFSTWHPEAYALDGARIVEALKSRRDKLVEVADEYFALVNRNVDILGSAHDDTFDLWLDDGGAVRLVVHDKDKDGNDKVPFFDRVFEPGETAELRLYALDGDDTLFVHGDAPTSIDIRFVGGQGKDLVSAAPGPRAAPLNAREIRVYDSEHGLTIDPSIEVRDERSNRASLNEYDQHENHDLDYGTFFPSLSINPDDGVYLGGRYTYLVHGYKKHPFAARHQMGAAFATGTLGAAMSYDGLFPQSAGLLDQRLDALVKTPSYTRNFYGLTNRYVSAAAQANFYRVRQAQYEARYGLSYGFGGDRTAVGGELVGQAIDTQTTVRRFVAVSRDVEPGAFGPRYFGGTRLFAETNTFDDLVLPKQGIHLSASAESRYDVAHERQLSTTFKGTAAAAIPIDRARRFVLVTGASLEGIVGPHPFYFAPTLGGTDLRAYHFQQLAGEGAFVHTTDLRIDVLRIYSGLPSTIGVNLSVDHGRVFGPSVTGNDYHLNYGGGVWWSILDVIGVSAAYYRGLDGGSRFVFSLGPLFSQSRL